MEIIKERNHFIPKTYLEKFLNNDSELYVYKKGKDFFKKGIIKNERLFVVKGKGGLNAIAAKNNLYIPEGDFAENRNIFENFFAQEIESKYNEFLAFIEANFFNAQEIFKLYRNYIILLIASMMSRTLHSMTEIEEMYKVNFQIHHLAQSFDKKREKKLKKLIKEKQPDISDEKAEKTIKDYLDMVSEGKFDVKIPRNLFIKHIFQNMEMYGRLISDMTIQILRCENPNYFITTDAPVVYFIPKKKVTFNFGYKGLGSPYIELYFPLSRNLCLLLTRGEIEVLTGLPVRKEIVDIVNDNLSHNSRNFFFHQKKLPFWRNS